MYGECFYCLIPGNPCYEPGVKEQGAVGYPAITYLPCCDGQEIPKDGEWGKFCLGK